MYESIVWIIIVWIDVGLLNKQECQNELLKDVDLSIIIVIEKAAWKIYLLEVNNRSTRTRCEIYLTLTIKTPERRQWGVSIYSFEHVIPAGKF